MASVLLADDEPADLRAAAAVLEADGHAVTLASNGAAAARLASEKPFDVVVTDLVMPGANGLEVIRAARRADPEAICIAMTSFGSADSAIDALNFGAYSYLLKPCDAAALRHAVTKGLEKQKLARELRQRNAELERRLSEMADLREVDRLKSAFLAHVSHDLKAPLTSIEGFLTLMSPEAVASLPLEERGYLEGIRAAAAHMEYLITQLVEAAQLTSGQVRLDLKPVNVPETIEEAAVVALGSARQSGLNLTTRSGFGPEPVLRADRGRLLQILGNLLGNAVKFTPEGGSITLWARPEGSEAHFCVEDTGVGIAPEHHARIFEKFYRVDPSLTAVKGLGLGLRIAKDLVDLHRGRLWVESAPGKGSRFHFTLPL